MKIEEDFSTTSHRVRIFDVAEFSVHDGPGTRVVVYFQGCNAQCDWCHSPHSQPDCSPLLFNRNVCSACQRCGAVCPNQVHKFNNGKHEIDRERCTKCGRCIESCPNSVAGIKGSALHFPTSSLSVSGLFSQLDPYIRLVRSDGGITLSGGEALLQPAAAEELLKACKQKGYHTAVETSGLLPLNTYKKVLPWVDSWLFGMRITTGSTEDRQYKHIDKVLELLKNARADILPRIPLIPGFFDRKRTLNSIISLLNQHSIRTVCLNPWNRDYELYYKQSGIPLRMPAPTSAEIKDCETKITSTFTSSNFIFYENKNIRTDNESESQITL